MAEKGKLYTIFGGQFGSEGKGEVASFLCKTKKIDYGVRIGGPNAGHTAWTVKGDKVVVQTVPTPVAFGATGIIGPEGMFITSLLLEELRMAVKVTGNPVYLYIDGNTAIIGPEHMTLETDLKTRIGSTGEGVGACTSDKIWRKPEIVVKHNLESLKSILGEDGINVVLGADTVTFTNDMLLAGRNVLIEGTQGYGLSLHTSGYYPYCTSRECTPQALWAGTGINPRNASPESEVIMVVRTYPIRVGGNSGPFPNELTWDDMAIISKGTIKAPEITTVTKKTRRIARMDMNMLKRAILQCRPDVIALTFLDYPFSELAGQGVEAYSNNPRAVAYVKSLQDELGVKIKYISTGPGSTFLADKE